MTQQTAVEWLFKELKNGVNYSLLDKNGYRNGQDILFEKAKQMEKEQLDKAYYKGQESKYIGGPSYCEQYYNETYGKE